MVGSGEDLPFWCASVVGDINWTRFDAGGNWHSYESSGDSDDSASATNNDGGEQGAESDRGSNDNEEEDDDSDAMTITTQATDGSHNVKALRRCKAEEAEVSRALSKGRKRIRLLESRLQNEREEYDANVERQGKLCKKISDLVET